MDNQDLRNSHHEFNENPSPVRESHTSPQFKKTMRANNQTKSVSSMNFHPQTTEGDQKFAVTYTDSVLWNQSSSTLMHSAPWHSFPKAQRFQMKTSSLQIDTINMPSTLGTKTTGMGYSQKQFIPESQLNNAKNIPASNFYHVKDFLELDEISRRGKSFGLSYSFYQRVYTPEMKHYPNPMFFKANPGPGSYNVVGDPGKNKTKFSIYAKGKTFAQMLKSEFPASNYYSPNRVLTEASRFKSPTFGYGTKIDLSKAANNFPGPGTYRLPSVFDKCKRKKKTKVQQ